MVQFNPPEREGTVAELTLSDGRVCVVEPLLFGSSRLGVDADRFGYSDIW